MEVLRISGGTCLKGDVQISGSKNAALPQFAATLLSNEISILKNIPDLSDVRFMGEILSELGANVNRIDKTTWEIDPANITHCAPYDLVRKMRASICLLGPLVGRLKKAEVPMPGGCVIGQRPIDLHLRALESLGASLTLRQGIVKVDGINLKGNYIFLGGRHGIGIPGHLLSSFSWSLWNSLYLLMPSQFPYLSTPLQEYTIWPPLFCGLLH